MHQTIISIWNAQLKDTSMLHINKVSCWEMIYPPLHRWQTDGGILMMQPPSTSFWRGACDSFVAILDTSYNHANRWVWLAVCDFLLVFYSKHSHKMHCFWTRGMGQIDGPITALLNATPPTADGTIMGIKHLTATIAQKCELPSNHSNRH